MRRRRRAAEALVAQAAASLTMPVSDTTDVEATLLWPTRQTKLSSDFGYRMNPVTGQAHQLHAGVDVPVPTGTEVVAVEEGVVTFAGWTESAGFMISIAHDGGWTTRYAHLSHTRARVGEHVVPGETIAYSGDTGTMTTGAHLHFEIWNGKSPMNPMAFRYRHLAGSASIVAALSKPGAKLAMGNLEAPAPEQFPGMHTAMMRR